MVFRKIIKWIENHPGLASWIQAVGAIVALGLTVYIAYDSSASQEKQAIKAVSSWAGHVQRRIDEEIAQSRDRIDDQGTFYSGIRSQDLYVIAQTISGEELPVEKIEAFTELRVLGMQHMAISLAFHGDIQQKGDGHTINWQKYQKAFEELKVNFDKCYEEFEKN